MSATDPDPTRGATSLERERWDAEYAFREREIAVNEREQQRKEAELELAHAQHVASRWKNPLVVAILAATVAAIGNAFVAYTNSNSQTKLEAQKSEQARILEMIKTGNPDTAAENLEFLLNTGLIKDPGIRRDLRAFLDRRAPGRGPSLPTTGLLTASSATTKLVAAFEGFQSKPSKDPFGRDVIGFGHVLTSQERRTGKLMVAEQPVDFRSGITSAQASEVLATDLAPVRRKVLQLVTVHLTDNQLAALTSFTYNVGIAALKRGLLTKLNSGKYDEVPREMRKSANFDGRVIPVLLRRRQAEIQQWNTP